MNIGLTRAANAMATAQKRLDHASQNLANVDTVGFKRRGTAIRGFEFQLNGRTTDGIETERTVDWSQGQLERTGNPYDLALHGPGFFAIDSPDGEVYTRAGQFKVDQGGVLQSAEGYPLAWNSLSGAIDPNGLPVTIDGNGTVYQGEGQLGQLRLVDFEDPQALVQDGMGYWHAPADLREVAHEGVLHQGALEGSNAVGLEEIVSLIDVQRSFEAASRVVSMINRTYERLTRSNG